MTAEQRRDLLEIVEDRYKTNAVRFLQDAAEDRVRHGRVATMSCQGSSSGGENDAPLTADYAPRTTTVLAILETPDRTYGRVAVVLIGCLGLGAVALQGGQCCSRLPHNEGVMPTAAAPPPSRVARRFVTVILCVSVGVVAYFGISATLGYTNDAYIRSDLIRVAPEVPGPIVAVHVRDNQHIEAGTVLVTIDRAPFELAVAAKRDRVASAQAVVALKTDARASQVAHIQSAQAALDLTQSEDRRVTDLANRGFASQQDRDKARDALRSSQSSLAVANAEALVAEREVDTAQHEVATAQADLAIAEYDLSRTQLTAPAAGYVNNFDLRAGRYALAGAPLVGIVDDSQWRVIANFKENVAASVAPGTRVWVWLDTKPWRLYRGHVDSVARGIARNEESAQLLPYVAATTDWVRLRRRFPVTILLDPPLPREALYMGADARVLFWR